MFCANIPWTLHANRSEIWRCLCHLVVEVAHSIVTPHCIHLYVRRHTWLSRASCIYCEPLADDDLEVPSDFLVSAIFFTSLLPTLLRKVEQLSAEANNQSAAVPQHLIMLLLHLKSLMLLWLVTLMILSKLSTAACDYFGKSTCEYEQCSLAPYYKRFCIVYIPDLPRYFRVSADYYCCDHANDLS